MMEREMVSLAVSSASSSPSSPAEFDKAVFSANAPTYEYPPLSRTHSHSQIAAAKVT